MKRAGRIEKLLRTGSGLRPDVELAILSLGLDAATAEVVGALRAAAIDSVLIKGPSTAHWLYPGERDARTYSDIDLLVSPADFHRVESRLLSLGFESPLGQMRPSEAKWLYETPWERYGSPPVKVDLHRGFHGVDDWEAWWRVMSSHTTTLTVAGTEVRVPDEAGCALIVALHDTGVGREAKSAEDLRRALEIFNLDVWREAGRRAAEVSAVASLSHSLSRHEAGRAVASMLGLPKEVGTSVAVRGLVGPRTRVEEVSRSFVLVHRLSQSAGVAAKARVLLDFAFPSNDRLRSMRPVAQRGLFGLIAARLFYPLQLAARAPRVGILVLKGRREARKANSRG